MAIGPVFTKIKL